MSCPIFLKNHLKSPLIANDLDATAVIQTVSQSSRQKKKAERIRKMKVGKKAPHAADQFMRSASGPKNRFNRKKVIPKATPIIILIPKEADRRWPKLNGIAIKIKTIIEMAPE